MIYLAVHHHIGGLERTRDQLGPHPVVHHHIGGLENKILYREMTV